LKFLVFPDHPDSELVATRFALGGMQVQYHASGRPWIVGSWATGDLTLAVAGTRRLAMLGRTTTSADVLAAALRHVRSEADLDAVARESPGCFHLISSVNGSVRVQGTLSDTLRIYYATVGGVAVAADRPDPLVIAIDARLDERVLASMLLAPYSRAPWPISERCLWQEIGKVPPGHWLQLSAVGTAKVVRWWQPPDAIVPLRDGAQLLRARLGEAVRARVDHTGSVGLSLDLSGGMDSTSLCYMTDYLGIPFTSVHHSSVDPSNMDTAWAKRCQQDLTSATHLVLPARDVPGAFSKTSLLPEEITLEGPMTLIHRELIETLARTVARAGSGRHLRGDGADELFRRSLTGTTALVRRYPLRYRRVVRRLKAVNRWSTWTTLLNLRRPATYQRWLTSVASLLTKPPDYRQRPGWEIPCHMPQWAEPAAVAAVRELFDEALAANEQPFVQDPVQHEIIRLVHLTGEAGRQCSMAGERFGVSFESPYLDDRVMEVALSVRLEDRAASGVNKRVLAMAMAGIAPPDVLGRRDKSHANRDMFDDLRRGRSRLEQLCAGPELARRGLVNAGALRATVLNLHADLTPMVQLGPSWATELWLRALPGRLAPPAEQPAS
jgi:asparagine synthase (glutamine-hydrolysing)